MLKIRKEQKEVVECAGSFCVNCEPDIKALEYSIEILSAYNKLQKENLRLRYQDISYLEGEIKGYKTRIEELKEENEELKYKYDRALEDLVKSKQKIKDKIEELEREFDFYAGREHAEWQDGEFDGEQCNDISQQIKILKELLEEEE